MKKLIPFLYSIQILAGIALLWIGCSGRQVAKPHPPTEQFWTGCHQTMPANPDGFQHFTCTDVKNRQWEILVRREGK